MGHSCLTADVYILFMSRVFIDVFTVNSAGIVW